MAYSFVRNDKVRFNNYSTFYDVYDDNELLTTLIVGYEKAIEKFFITYLCHDRFYEEHNERQNTDIKVWRKIIIDFVDIFESLFTLDDIVSEKYIYRRDITTELKKENILYYISNLRLDEEDYRPVTSDNGEEYLDELLENEYLIPKYIDCDYFGKDRLESYSIDTFADIYYDMDLIDSIYATINYDLIYNSTKLKIKKETETI